MAYSAAWGADPEEIFTRALGSPDWQPLDVRAHLLSVSSQGELAVSTHPISFGPESAGGTLALVPGVGGPLRPVAENILYADWSRKGELAVVRYVDSKHQVEYPLGKPLFESGGAVGFLRVSPSGTDVAFYRGWPETEALLLIDGKGTLRQLVAGSLSGLAWHPNGHEVWYAQGAAIWATSLTGSHRLVYQGVAPMKLEDISPQGKV